MTISAPKPRFNYQDSDEYNISSWGGRYFGVDDDGNLTVTAEDRAEVALSDIIYELRAQGKALPLILRFPQIIESRIARLNGAFENAIGESGYRNRYQGVYPIKVNQRRVVVETIAEYGEHYRTGFGSGQQGRTRAVPGTRHAPRGAALLQRFQGRRLRALGVVGP